MADFFFMEDGVNEAINMVNQVHQEGVQQATNIRNVVKPLQGGEWIGESAKAFYEAIEVFLQVADETNDSIQSLMQRLQHSEQSWLEAMQSIIAIING